MSTLSIIEPVFMIGGGWVKPSLPAIKAPKPLLTGEEVYYILTPWDKQIKLVSANSKTSKYFTGSSISEYDPAKWNTYTETSPYNFTLTVDWGFNTPFSDISYAFNNTNQTTKAPISVAEKLFKQGIYNLEPFKIVRFSWLESLGKAFKGRNQKTDKGTFDFGLMAFDGTEPYLPLGDCMIKQGSGETWVILVKNESKYCTRIDDGSWKFVSRSRGCNGGNVWWSTRAVQDNNRNYGNYKVVGDIFTTGDSDWWWWNPKSAAKGILKDGPRAFAAVDPRYLTQINSIKRDSSQVKIVEIDGDYSCRYRQMFSVTSPFNTFNITANEDTGGGERNWNTTWPTYIFFDIVPRVLIAQCCSNTLGDINPDPYCKNWSVDGGCKQAMVQYCQGDMLKSEACMSFCKSNDCDNAITSYCNANTYEEQKNKYTSMPNLCSCFMPRTFYEKYDEEKYQAMGPSGKKLVELLKASGVYGGQPECSNLQCKFGGSTIQHSTFKLGSCPNVQIQNCINEQATANQGTIKAGSIDQSQANNCVQQSSTTNQTSLPSSPSPPSSSPPSSSPPSLPSPSSSSSTLSGNPIILDPQTKSPSTQTPTTLYLIVGGIILLILIIIIIILLL